MATKGVGGVARVVCPALCVLLAVLVAHRAAAQEIEPRAYSNIPVGVNFLVAGYGGSSGGLATDPSLTLEDADLRTDVTLLAYARGIGVAGKSGKVDVIVPFSWVSGTALYAGEPVRRRVSGFGDPRLRFSLNLYGAPAMSVEDLAGYQQDVIVGVSVQVAAPLGQYDETRLVNIGTNRWSVKTEVGVSKVLGAWTFEFAPAVTFYTDNGDFYGGRTREQDPIYAVQGGVIYGFRSGVWVAVNGTYYTGGRSSVDGVEGEDLRKNSLVGMTVALPVNRNHSVKIYGSTGLATRVGVDVDTVGVAWQFRWGGGL